MILQKYLNNESLKYFLHATSKLNWEGILKRGMIWPYVALLKLWDLQIWGKVENSFWEVPILLLTFGTGGQREFEDRGQRETQLPPSSSQGTTGEQEEGKEKLLAINHQQREKEGNTTTSSPVHHPLKGEGKCRTISALQRLGNL